MPYTNIDVLKNKTFKVVYKQNNAEIYFVVNRDEAYKMFHEQDCCESVSIEDINGDLNDLEGSPLLLAEERVSHDEYSDDMDDSNTWTFYTFRTMKGDVTIRWHGSSNGYYSEGVDIERVDELPDEVLDKLASETNVNFDPLLYYNFNKFQC